MLKIVTFFLEKIIQTLNFILGKGYGTSSIKTEFRLSRSLLDKPPEIILDIGANIGIYTVEAASKFPNAQIHLFEPSPTNFEILQSRFIDNPNVHLNNLAISNVAGVAHLYMDEYGSGLASLTKRKLEHFDISYDKSEVITTLRLEEYWNNTLHRSVIDILKIDIEGHELDALESLGDGIAHIKIVQFEFGGCNIDTKTYFQNFWHFFQRNNFDVYRISPLGLIKISRYSESYEVFLTTNYLAANKSIVNLS
jgi:FkbM family methyltransferase